MNNSFVISLGFSHDQKFIVCDMKNAKSKYELSMERSLAEKIADHQLTLPADIGGHAVSIKIKRNAEKLVYSAEIVQKISSDKNVFERGEIIFKTGDFVGDLKDINCGHRIAVNNNAKIEEMVQRNFERSQIELELGEKSKAVRGLKEFRIPGINIREIAARLGA